MKNQISMIIPVLNEEGNIQTLVKRINTAMILFNYEYEIIFVDDHSTDKTIQKIKAAQKKYPVKYITKNGNTGKAASIKQGFQYCQYEIIGIIDADLQYPPEAIIPMVSMIAHGEADIVVAHRNKENSAFIRKWASNVFQFVFSRGLHQLNVDVQSGLKVLKKEIINRFTIEANGWDFDLEFLLKSRSAGYRIGQYGINFFSRESGSSKIKLAKTIKELVVSSIYQKIIGPQVIPFSQSQVKSRGRGFNYNGHTFINHTKLPINQTAFFQLDNRQKYILWLIVALFILCMILNAIGTLSVMIVIISSAYILDLVFNSWIIAKSLANAQFSISKQAIKKYAQEWPTYTILCPLYKEWQVIPQFVKAIENIDYPIEKLQVLLLLEEDDHETISQVKKMSIPAHFQVVVVPDSQPKTKPKACNYGLKKATGEYVVIYDAEDMPDPDQLKKAVVAFNRSDSNVICIQSKLNYYNADQNLLTRLFAAEYSMWFDLILPGLHTLKAPIPLGGTSNHFVTKSLKKLHGWDAFNVTEDCDLGIRLAQHGYITRVLDSTTWEEGNSQLYNWYRQRSRWIKGYIQTYLVHMRNPGNLIKKSGVKSFIIFQVTVGSKILAIIINPILWLLTIMYFVMRVRYGALIESLFPVYIYYFAVFCAVFGNFLYFYFYMIACAKRGQDYLVKYTFFVPFYWIAMSVAAWRAVYEIIVKPHYWAKTVHGLHLAKSETPVIDFDDDITPLTT